MLACAQQLRWVGVGGSMVDGDERVTAPQATVQHLRAHLYHLDKKTQPEPGVEPISYNDFVTQYNALLDKFFPKEGTPMQKEYRKALNVVEVKPTRRRLKGVFSKFDFELYRGELLEFLHVLDLHIGESYIVQVRWSCVCASLCRAAAGL